MSSNQQIPKETRVVSHVEVKCQWPTAEITGFIFGTIEGKHPIVALYGNHHQTRTKFRPVLTCDMEDQVEGRERDITKLEKITTI